MVVEIQPALTKWFRANSRDLPWRADGVTPWQIFVSEVMLQQTPANRVAPQWEEWIARWPDALTTSQASPAQILRQWDRLGYPRRALRILEAANIVVQDFAGEMPRTYEELISLPGVGDYTANAILAFAFKQKSVVLDTNVRRVIGRVWHGKERPEISISSVERLFAESLVPSTRTNASLWNAAVMEFGALVCTSRNPLCDQCKIASNCAWKLAGYPASTVVKKTAKFEGTDRQVRGRMMKILKDSNKAVDKAAFAQCSVDAKQRNRALDSLITDGLIEVTRTGKFRLPN
jgi:A/G-specific adenine glycosylase